MLPKPSQHIGRPILSIVEHTISVLAFALVATSTWYAYLIW